MILDTGLALGGQTMSLLTHKGTFQRLLPGGEQETLVPLQLGGSNNSFMGLPAWLVSAEGRGIIGVALGALFFGALDLRRVVPRLVLESARPAPPI